jgi:hypothetical protein
VRREPIRRDRQEPRGVAQTAQRDVARVRGVARRDRRAAGDAKEDVAGDGAGAAVIGERAVAPERRPACVGGVKIQLHAVVGGAPRDRRARPDRRRAARLGTQLRADPLDRGIRRRPRAQVGHAGGEQPQRLERAEREHDEQARGDRDLDQREAGFRAAHAGSSAPDRRALCAGERPQPAPREP